MPLAWETDLNDMIEMDELFTNLLRRPESFEKMLQSKSIFFDKREQLQISVRNPNVKGQSFGFANVLDIMIGDGDPERKHRSFLLDTQFKSVIMFIDDKKSILHVLLFG